MSHCKTFKYWEKPESDYGEVPPDFGCAQYEGPDEDPNKEMNMELPILMNHEQDKLMELMARCKCGVYVNVNSHRDTYETAAQWWETQDICGDSLCDTSPEVRAEMIRLDTVIDLQFYPDTPLGFCRVVHYDLDAALDAAMACFTPSVDVGRISA